jgi:hypothetical protein
MSPNHHGIDARQILLGRDDTRGTKNEHGMRAPRAGQTGIAGPRETRGFIGGLSANRAVEPDPQFVDPTDRLPATKTEERPAS